MTIKTTLTLVTPPTLHLVEDAISVLLIGAGKEWKEDATAFAHQWWRSKNLAFFHPANETTNENLAWVYHHLKYAQHIIINVTSLNSLDQFFLGLYANDPRLVVCIPDGYSDLRLMLSQFKVQVFPDHRSAVQYLIKKTES